MKSCFSFVLCILAFVSPPNALAGHNLIAKSNSAITPTRGQKTPSSHTTVTLPKSSTSYLTHRSHGATRSQKKKPPSHTIVPKSSGKVPTDYPTSTPVGPPIGPTSYQKPKSSISQATKTPKPPPPPATTSPNLTTTHKSTGTSTLVSASKTLAVSNGQTASAQVGWLVVGAGVGGFVAVGGSILPIEGGTEAIVIESNSGQGELSTISHSDTSTTPTTSSTSTSTTSRSTSTSTSRSTTSSTSSSSTSSSTASPTPYNIYPKFDSTRRQQSAFAQDLGWIAQPGSVRSITGGQDQLLLWVASLTPAQASELSRNPVVRSLNVDQPLRIDLETVSASGTPPSPDCPQENCSHQKRDGSVLMQQDAPDELKVISQARGASLGLPGYAYDARGGRGITVYVMDTGINPDHLEFRNVQGSMRWLYIPGEPQIERDEIGHGTCVASKVVGSTFGVAKSANIVVVKMQPIADWLTTSHIIAAWGVVARDIASNSMQGKAVISATLSVDPNEFSENDRITYIESIRELIDFDAVLVTASANIHAGSPGLALATYPSLLASQFPIVVVGAVDTSGIYAPYSQGLAAELTVSAVGRVVCASRQGGTSQSQGTSYAAPAVAGLAAYLMSLDRYSAQLLVRGSVARNVRDLIKSLAYARLHDQPVAIWNGIDSRQIYYCPVRRDSGSSGCPARNTTSPNVPPVTASSNAPLPSIMAGTSTTSATSSSSSSIAPVTSTTTLTSSSSPPPSITMTDLLATTSSAGGESFTATLTISLGGSTEVEISLGGS